MITSIHADVLRSHVARQVVRLLRAYWTPRQHHLAGDSWFSEGLSMGVQKRSVHGAGPAAEHLAGRDFAALQDLQRRDQLLLGEDAARVDRLYTSAPVR